MKIFRLWGKRVSVTIGLIIMIFMVMDFNSRIALLTQLRTQKEIEEQTLQDLQMELAILQSRVEFASSEYAVEEWAREEGHLQKPGDHVMILMPDASVNIDLLSNEVIASEPTSNWEEWIKWLTFSAP